MVKKILKQNEMVENKPAAAEKERLGLERLIFFSDAVFAIAITLLALEVRLPAGDAALGNTELSASLFGMWQKILGYVISFLVIGSFWSAHHRKFGLIRRFDGNLLLLNLLILMVVAFIPFPSSVISESGTLTATIFYALTMTLAGLLFTALWGYAAHHDRLIDPTLTPQQRRREFITPLSTVAIFLISIGIAFLDASLARFVWVLILPATVYARR